MSEDKAQYQAGQQLKPCPFCGSDNVDDWETHVRCHKCGARGPWQWHVEGEDPMVISANAWNTRAADAEVERLRAQLAAARAALELLAIAAHYNDHRDDWRNPDCGLRLEHEAAGKDAPTPWQFAADALEGLE